jgi:hypothetical protein
MIHAFEQSPECHSSDRAQNQTESERQFGSLEYHVVVVDASDSKGHTDNTANAHERNQSQQSIADHTEDAADFLDLLKFCLNFGLHKISFEQH